MSDSEAPAGRGSPLRQTQLDVPNSRDQKVRLAPDAQHRQQKITGFLTNLVKEVAAQVAAKGCCLYILDLERQHFVPYSVWQVNDSPVMFNTKAVDEGIIGLATQAPSQTPAVPPPVVRVDDIHNQQVRAFDTDLAYRSALAVPLRLVDGDTAGVLLVVDKLETPGFLPQDEQTLLHLVNLSGVSFVIEDLILYQQERPAQESVRLKQQLQQRIDELAGLRRVSSELNSTFDHERVLTLVLHEAVRVTRADYGRLYLYAPEIKEFAVTRDGEGATLVQAALPAPPMASQALVARLNHRRHPVLVSGLFEDQDNSGQAGEFRSAVLVPVYYGDELAGLIHLESKQLDFFNQDQLIYLEALSSQASVAVYNARTFQEQKLEREQASRRAEQLARLSEISNAFRTNRPLHDVLEDIAYAIVESVGYEVALISLVEGTPPRIRHQVGAGIPLAELKALRHSEAAGQPLAVLEPVMSDEFRLSNSYFVPAEKMGSWRDKFNVPYLEKERPFTLTPGLTGESEELWRTGDLLLTPLRDTEENIIGLLTVESPDNYRRPDPASVETLEVFANYAAVAIESARLFELEQHRRRLADTLRGVAEAISSQLDFDELLNIVLQALRKVVDYDSTSVQLLQEDRLVIIGGQGWEDRQQILGLSFSMEGDNPNRIVIETQEPLIVKDSQQEYPISFGPPHDHIRSWLGVPLTYGTNVLGLMAVDSKQVNFFTGEDAQVVLAFANQVAVALQNAQLFEEARRQVRQLAALTDVAQALNRALDLNEVLNLVLDAVFDILGHHKGSIWLIDNTSRTVKIANTKNVSDVLVELFNESAVSIDSEPFASVIKSGQVLVIKSSIETDNTESDELVPYPGDVTYVPLKTEEGVIGILAIEATIHGKNMLQLVTTLADLAAVAIDSARLLEDTRRHASEMQHLYNLGVEVSRVLDVGQVMRAVISNALSLTQTQVGTILLWDEGTKGYIINGAINTDSKVAKLLLAEIEDTAYEETKEESNISNLWCNLTRQVAAAGQAVVFTPPPHGTQGVDTELGASLVRHVLPLGIRTVLAVPIQIQHQTTGAIFVSSLVPRSFNQHELQLLSFMASQAAVAISNAQLVQRLNVFNEELERRVDQRTMELARTLQDLTEERDRVGTLYQITRELAASFDLDRMLIEALSLLNRAIGISQGAILLLDQDSDRLICRAALGHDKPLPRGGLKTPYRLGYGLAGKVMEERRPRLVPDLLQDPDWVAGIDSSQRRAAIAIPLITGEEVLGAMLLFHPEAGYFNEDHLKLVTAAGAQVATAINNAELYRLITDQAERLGVMLRTQAAEAAKNQAILRGITDGVLVLDASRHIVLLNPKAGEILQVEPAFLENQHVSQMLSGRPESPEEFELTRAFYDNLLAALSEIETGQRSAGFRLDVAYKAITVTLAPVALGAETTPSVVAVIRDITKEAEIERIKDEFISTVSHELRTPMTSIKGYADLLVSGNSRVGALNPTQERFVRIIQSNANRLTDLVNDILEISRIETGRVKLELQALDIGQIIRDTTLSFEGQQVKKPMRFSQELSERLPNVYADKARLTQILVNLIGNAWQYTPEGGSITVRARAIDEHFVQVDVEDTGIGIIEKDVDYIFDRFFRSERPEVQVVDGTGLGLSITKMFVEMLGGEIWVKSKLDVGTTFSFTVPIAAGPAPGDDTIFDTIHLPRPPHVLIIDDEPGVVQALKLAFEKKGYRVLAAENQETALSFARTSGKALSLIVLDILLKNTDGFTLLEQLREDEAIASIPLVVTSLAPSVNEQELALEVVDYIATSFEDTQVLASVKAALDKLETGNGMPAFSGISGSKSRILIADSNLGMVQRLKEALDASGYEVHRAFNTQQALDMALSSRPDLILLNAGLVDSSGETVVSRLAKIAESKDVPIIVVTDKPAPAPDTERVTVLGKRSGIGMRRPVTAELLVAELEKAGAHFVASEAIEAAATSPEDRSSENNE